MQQDRRGRQISWQLGLLSLRTIVPFHRYQKYAEELAGNSSKTK